MRKYLAGLMILAMAALTACDGGGGSNGSSLSGGSSTANLSGIQKTPDYSWHESYMAGSHANFECGTTCHALPLTNRTSARTDGVQGNTSATADRTQICYQCHSANYNSTNLFNHASHSISTYCNSCHYSDSFTSHSRVSHTEWHSYLTTSCLSCHSGRAPSTHASDGRASTPCEACHTYSSGSWGFSSGGAHIYTSGCSSCHISTMPANHYGTTCESCHSYPSWAGASFTHTGISSGCASCHSGHYSGFACEGCHTSGISWSYSHSRVSNSNCIACHADGAGHGDGEDDEGGHGGDDNRVSGLLYSN
ncbi:MAG: hypothetical protein HY751_10080 [Nitrospinae bacterium]|nr:hypothetical protein [Nitrospinota bacterium]